MSDNGGGNETGGADSRRIHKASDVVDDLLSQLDDELPNPTANTKRQLTVALNRYRRKLRTYRGDDALETPWDERDVDVDVVEELLKRTTTKTKQLNRRGSPVVEETVPVVEVVDPTLLQDVAEELHDIKFELGFRDETEGSTHRTEIDEELIEEVEQWRKQNLEA